MTAPWWCDPVARASFERGTRDICPWLVGAADRLGFRYSALSRIHRMGHIQLIVRFKLRIPDEPAVFSPPLGGSPHRNPDGSMCLWYPRHPLDQRWEFSDGLCELVLMAAAHLRREDLWRRSSPRYRDRRWPGPEMPHGQPEDYL